MSWAAVAVGAGTAVAGIANGMMSAKGAKESGATMREAAEIGSRTALEMDNRARADMQPYRELGIQSGNMLSQVMAGNTSLDALFKGSSLYDWESEMGSRNINRQLKARGMYNSGAGLETLAMFEKGLVAEEGSRWWDRLFNTTALGSNAAARTATGTSQTGNNLANLQTQSGIAQGAAVQKQYDAYGGMANSIVGGIGAGIKYDMYSGMMDRLSSGRNSNAPSSGRTGDPLYDAVDTPAGFTTSWMS